MAPVDPHKRLLRKSGAYRAYLELDALPDNAPEFGLDGDWQPQVHIAEHFCRVRLHGFLCGKKHASRFLLDQHLRAAHHFKPKNQRHQDTAMIEAADGFYRALLRGYAWPDFEYGESNTAATTALPKLEPRIVELSDAFGDASATTALRKQESRTAKTTNNDLGDDSEQRNPDPPRKLCSRPQEPRTSTSGKAEDLEIELKRIRIQKQMYAAELKEVEIQKQMHAAELKELEIEQALLLLKKGEPSSTA